MKRHNDVRTRSVTAAIIICRQLFWYWFYVLKIFLQYWRYWYLYVMEMILMQYHAVLLQYCDIIEAKFEQRICNIVAVSKQSCNSLIQQLISWFNSNKFQLKQVLFFRAFRLQGLSSCQFLCGNLLLITGAIICQLFVFV